MNRDATRPATAATHTAPNTPAVPAAVAAGASMPHAAVETVPPKPLKNMAMEVARPASAGSAPVWAARLDTGMPMPTPRPSTAATAAQEATASIGDIAENVTDAARTTADDAAAMARSRPVARNAAPDVLLPTMRASVMGMSTAPDEAAAMPSPSWRSLGR